MYVFWEEALRAVVSSHRSFECLQAPQAASKYCSGFEHEADKGTLQDLHRLDSSGISQPIQPFVPKE